MISLPSGTRIWLVAGITDMRKSFNGLGEQVQHVLNDNPFSGHLFSYVMNTRKVHTDDTPVKVLAPGRKKAKTGYIWTYVRDDRNAGSPEPPAVWFAYSPDHRVGSLTAAACHGLKLPL